MKFDNECVITKFTFFIDPHNIITYNIVNHIIYIYQIIQQNKFKLSIILLITLLWGFFFIFYEFWSIFYLLKFFFQNIRRYFFDISDISVKSNYRYIRSYRYFHHCFRLCHRFTVITKQYQGQYNKRYYPKSH